MKRIFSNLLILIAGVGAFSQCSESKGQADMGEAPVAVWLTHADKSALFERQQDLSLTTASNVAEKITLAPDSTFQEIDGFGFTLTGGSALHIHNMSSGARADLLKELFDTAANHIGISYLRISIGASDLDERPFSYNDLPEGETDEQMRRFTLDQDRLYLIPILKEILAINPQMKILGSPWSPPTWMKTNKDTRGGSLRPEYYDAYARYFVRYIQEMAAEGIRLDAITVQNEPLHPGNNPSLLMVAEEQAAFIKDHLGPAFEKADLATKIILYDHNADRPDYPISILDDPEARKYVDGTAFHLYGGDISALSEVHAAHPDKHLYFTEQWIGAPGDFQVDIRWHLKNLIIGATRNWSRNVLEWNLASDPNLEPHTDRGGCDRCLGAVTIAGDKVERNSAYYIVAHASKFVRPGSWRIASNEPADLSNVAFMTPLEDVVAIVMNDSSEERKFLMELNGRVVEASLKPGAVGTYVWRNSEAIE